MTWLLWRQHRTQAIATAIALTVFAIAVAVTGVHMANVYASARACTPTVTCFSGHLFSGYGAIIDTVHLTLIVPILLGGFVAAPLVAREAEQHTNATVWTQSITRRRWIAGKTTAVIVAGVVIASITSALVTWWSGTTNSLNGDRFQGAQFDTQNIAPIAYALFAIGLGLLTGAWLRRALPAIATTIVVYIAVRMTVGVFVRPHWEAPITRLSSSGVEPVTPKGSWILSQDLVDAKGQVTNGRLSVPESCTTSRRAVATCLDRVGYHMKTTFQPASHYWRFQLLEAGLFIGLGAVLVAGAVVLTLRRDA